jgi:hypothetical protein
MAKNMVTSTKAHAKSPRTRIITSRPLLQIQQSFKMDSEGSSDEKHVIQTIQSQSEKRVAPRQFITPAAPKRIKIQQTILHKETADSLDASEPEIVTPQEMKNNEPQEFVEMSMEVKQEPDWETTEYEEPYFTEGDDTTDCFFGIIKDEADSKDEADEQGKCHIL